MTGGEEVRSCHRLPVGGVAAVRGGGRGSEGAPEGSLGWNRILTRVGVTQISARRYRTQTPPPNEGVSEDWTNATAPVLAKCHTAAAPDITTVGNWTKGVTDLAAVFPTVESEVKIISK